ncbi:MAG: amidohydrolase family protein [Anaerolineae bacterium]|nr:amidohydrolase family protein [Anaerolineae bacterium]
MLTRLPGLIDAHVHLRTPGQTHKEDLVSGTHAALAGGFTCLLDMPNTTPPIVDEATLADKLAGIHRDALCDVYQFVGGSAGQVEHVASLAGRAVGLKLYLGQTHGPLLLESPQMVIELMRRWPGVVAVHAEGWQLAAAIGLARLLDRPLHVCHVARGWEIALIRRAKEAGANVTCEVTPHHLLLTDADARALGPLGYMKPELGTAEDRAALWANLHVFDCVASDHAPHTLVEKAGDNPPPGVPGLETTLPLMLTAVHRGRLSLARLVELLYDGPRRIYNLPEQPDTTIEVDLHQKHTLTNDGLRTRCGWTPFAGMAVVGKVMSVTLRSVSRET